MAMIILAAGVHGQGDVARAMSLAAEAVEIEPNMFLYRQELVEYTAAAGLPRVALDYFHQAQEIFPHVHDLHEKAIELYLYCGDPESAQNLIAEAIVDDARRADLLQIITHDLAAKAQAAERVRAAQAHVERKEWQPALEALQCGNALYNKDRLLNINYALALSRAGNAHVAAGVLLEAATVVPGWCIPLCKANAAYCLVDAGDHAGALRLLAQVADDLLRRHSGTMPIHPADLPGVAIWMGSDHWIEERLHTASRRIDSALAAAAGNQEPPHVRELAKAVRQASLEGGVRRNRRFFRHLLEVVTGRRQ